MRPRIALALTLICAGCLSVPTQRAQTPRAALAQVLGEAGPKDAPGITGLPDQGYTTVGGYSTLKEDWGSVTLRLEVEGYEATALEPLPPGNQCAPVVRAQGRCGPCELRTVIFRAPTYPTANDVIRATVTNHAGDATKATLVVDHTASGPDFTLSAEALLARDRRLIGLPAYAEPTLPMNDWGLASNAGPIAGWARPDEPCDPAFRNISVGWRGEPITYRFKVEPNAGRTVILGLCESHWTEPERRPLILQVEGAADLRVDPIGEWGQHVPKCLPFQAKDVNGDGWLTVTSITPPDAPDRNSILNVIWLFPANAAEDPEAVKRGERSEAAEYYVDLGGERDQSLYTVAEIPYHLELQPGEERALTFVVATQGGPASEGPQTPVEADRLLANAEGLWREWFEQGCRISIPEPGAMEVWNASLAGIMMLRGQASKYIIPRPSIDPNSFSYEAAADIVRALDLNGHHRDAEACLLMLWDSPLPKAIAQYGQREDGSWRLADDDWCSQGRVLTMLAEHYAITGDRGWLAKCYPGVVKGVEWLDKALKEHEGLLPGARSNPNQWAMEGLRGASSLAAALGKADDERRISATIRRLRAAMVGFPVAWLAQLDWEAGGAEVAGPAKPVPFSHWAYDAVQRLVDEGVIIGYPDRQEFRGDRELTRYEFAMAISRLMAWPGLLKPPGTVVPSDSEIRAICAKPDLTEDDTRALCAKLLDEFKSELVDLMEQIDELAENVDELDDRVWQLEGDAGPSPAVQRLRRLVGEASPQGFLATRVNADTREAQGAFPDAHRGAVYVRELRRVLIREAGDDLRLMPLAPAQWLAEDGGIAVEGAATNFGAVSLRARIVGNTLRVAITPPARLSGRIWVSAFASEERKPVRLQIDGEGWRGEWTGERRAVWLSPSTSEAVLTVEYE